MATSIKLHVRAVRGPGFSVALPAGLATRVGDAKAAVEAAPQARRRAVAHLIHAGKVLADGLTLHDCGYSSSDFVVAVFTKRRKLHAGASASSSAAAAAASASAGGSSPPKSSPRGKQPQSIAARRRADQEFLVNMGFEVSQVIRALAAAHGDREAAAQLLASGTVPPPGVASGSSAGGAAGGGAAGGGSGGAAVDLTGAAVVGEHGMPQQLYDQLLELRNVAHDTPFMLQECLDAACEENPDLMALVDANGVHRVVECMMTTDVADLEQLVLPGAGGGLAGATGLGGVAQVYGGDGVVELDAGMLGGEEDDLPPLATPPAAVELTAEQEETVEQLQGMLGVDAAAARAALIQAHGDQTVAANLLLGGGMFMDDQL